jgi:Protein of unknown function (DUF2852)
MTCCSLDWRDRATAGGEGQARDKTWPGRPWRGWEIALMVIGFVVFWPVGLAILFWILWRKREGASPPPAWLGRLTSVAAGSGNSAFEAWKQGEVDRLEQERRKLADAEREFAAFLDQLKRARDREEFDRFMAARARAAEGPSAA